MFDSESEGEFELGGAPDRTIVRPHKAASIAAVTPQGSAPIQRPVAASFSSVVSVPNAAQSRISSTSSSSRVHIHSIQNTTDQLLPESTAASIPAVALKSASFSSVSKPARPTFSHPASSFSGSIAAAPNSTDNFMFLDNHEPSEAAAASRFDNLFNKLNPCQQEAVLSDSSPLLLVAAAGSGKTLTLTARLMHFLERRHVPPSNFLALTFTVKAAEEMRSRVEKALGFSKASAIHICNFHSLALRVLREHWVECRFKQQFVVLSLHEQRELIKECVSRVFERRGSTSSYAQQLISGAAEIEADDTRLQAIQADIIQSDRANSSAFSSKNKDDSPHAELTSYFVSFIRGAKNKGKRPSDYRDADHVNVYNMYAKLCQERGLIDFGDMIPMAIDLLQRRSDILQTYQNLYRCVLVDEYQDIDAQQFELLMLISRQHGNITVCGDDDQAIYGWRGSSTRSFQMFQSAFPAHHMIVLSQTYRSTQTICRAVNALIESNSERTKKQLWTQNIEGGPIKVMVAQDAGRECDMILAAIRNLRQNQHCRWSQICVLARTRKVLTAFESVLKKAGLPVFSTAHPNSKKKLNVDKCKELQTILAIAELVSSDSVDSAFRRAAQRCPKPLSKSILDEIESHSRIHRQPLMSAARACAAPSHRGLPAKQKTKLLEFVQLIDQMRTTCVADVDVADVRAALSHILESTEYYEHLQRTYDAGDEALKKENIELLLDRAASFDQTDLFEASDEQHTRLARLKAFVDSVRDGDGDNRREAPDVIFLSTVHQAKGMEFDYVFVVRFNEGMMPLSARGSVSLVDDDGSNEKSADDCEQQLQEERRLAYVACSRAKLQLHLSFILTDFTGATCQPSRFLSEIPESTTDAQACKTVEAEPPKDVLSVFTSKSVAPFSASAAKSAPFSAPVSTPFKAPSPFKPALSVVQPITPSSDVPASPVFATPKPVVAEVRSQPPPSPVVAAPRSTASFNVAKPFSAPASFQSALALSQRSGIELDRKPAVTVNVGGNAWAGEASQVSKHLFRPASSLLDPSVVAPPALATASIPTFSLAARIRASNQSSDVASNPTNASTTTKASTPPPPSLLCLLKRPSNENRTSDNLPNKRPFISSLLSKP